MKSNNLSKTSLLCSLLCTIMFITGCSNDDDENFLGNVTITVTGEDDNDALPLQGLTVQLLNTTDNTSREGTTDASGKAHFPDIPAGTYNAAVSHYVEGEDYTLSGSQTGIAVESNLNTEVEIRVRAVDPNGTLVIKEIYYNGANDGYVTLFKDQFIEIFNNSDQVIYADGLYIANLFGETGASGHQYPLTDMLDTSEYVYADFIEQVPGDGDDYPIAPGNSIVIALNAMNFKEANPGAEFALDNTGADLERYSVAWKEAQGLEGSAFFDFDNPNVPNMINIYIEGALCLFDSYGTSAVIFRTDKAFGDTDIVEYYKYEGYGSPSYLMKIPVSDIIDGVDFLENSQAAAYKRLPDVIDSGFNYLKADGGAFYSSMSMRRKVDENRSTLFGRVVLQDTDNSGADFESIDYPDAKGYNALNF
ncbi:DUF4876 domain-containing protein [Sinomicrobium soli]|uniref:DUF4876 domain-containing protein n=1 Tax=Sinomicrobium sp. N-1-3-6 TaxID=2219864 RepID=UPI000DCD796E|nr:DUF4876 domain-containing protein [Sinomicrobium sp. N-1-3-6]RAV29084.1 hypothetical protein DN748_09160 [Sinomicrobium sp. N-1-3-6]